MKMMKIYLLVFIIFQNAFIYSQSTINSIFEIGKKDYENGYCISAIMHFNLAIKFDSLNADAYYYKGLSYLKCERADISDSAVYAFKSAISINPKAPYKIAYLYLADKFFLQDKLALEYVTKAIKIDSTDSESYLLSAFIKWNLHLNSEVIKDIDKAIQLDPNKFRPHYMRGQFYYYLENNYKKAYWDFKLAKRYAKKADLTKDFYVSYAKVLDKLGYKNTFKHTLKFAKISNLEYGKLEKVISIKYK